MKQTPPGGRKPARKRIPLLLVLAAIALMSASPPASTAATVRHDRFPLHAGSAGPRVSSLQWLLHGGRPGVFRQVKPTFVVKPNGYFGARTKSALTRFKYRVGFPRAGQCGSKVDRVVPTAGKFFFNLVEGKTKRSACWVALAAHRVVAVNVGPTPLAAKVKAYELHLLALGIREVPDGSNRGPAVSYPAFGVPALQSGTGQYGVAWCVSTQQTVLKTLGYGTFADDTAGVYYAVDWAASRNLLSAKPKVGALVAFIDYDRYGHRIPGTGHMGFVSKAEASSFTYIAGNDGNRMNEHTIADGSRSYAFIYLPGLA